MIHINKENIKTIGISLSPGEKEYSLQEAIIECEKRHTETSSPTVFHYYVHDTNNTQADADKLALLFNPKIWTVTISIICEQNKQELIENFQHKLMDIGYQVRILDLVGRNNIAGMMWFCHP